MGELTRLNPAELLISETDADKSYFAGWPTRQRPPWHFDTATAREQLCLLFGTQDLTAFGCGHMPLAIGAAGCALQYLKDTQPSMAMPHIRSIGVEYRGDSLLLDAATRRNLELEHSLSGDDRHTLIGVLDSTATSMGGRLLRRWVNRPLRDHALLNARYAGIAALREAQRYQPLRELLGGIIDIERIGARIALKSARPRDLSGLRDSLATLPGIAAQLQSITDGPLRALASTLETEIAMQSLLDRVLVESPPLLIRDGGVIARGYDTDLDQLCALSQNADQFLLDLEARERASSGIANLKVSYNRVHGYYIEVSRTSGRQGSRSFYSSADIEVGRALHHTRVEVF